MSKTRTTVIAAFVIVLTFAAGVIGGAAAHHLLALRRPPLAPPGAHLMVRHLGNRLDLTDAQRKQIEAIMQRRHEQMRTELDATHAEIARVLTLAQREKFEKMRLRVGRAHERHFGR